MFKSSIIVSISGCRSGAPPVQRRAVNGDFAAKVFLLSSVGLPLLENDLYDIIESDQQALVVIILPIALYMVYH